MGGLDRQLDLISLNVASGSQLTTTLQVGDVVLSSSLVQHDYQLHFKDVSLEASVEYTLTMPTLEAGSTHLLIPDPTQNVVNVEIDVNSDGQIDQTIIVGAPSNYIYLPMVSR